MTAVVVMGIAGSGKSTVGRALALRLGVPFLEGDDCHPVANVAKMHAGIPLDDADRAPWLAAIARWIAAHEDGGVASCSALRRSYRDRLRQACGDCVRFVLLDVDARNARVRVGARPGHFMPVALVDSQMATLEPPDGEPHVLTLDATAPVEAMVKQIAAWLAPSG